MTDLSHYTKDIPIPVPDKSKVKPLRIGLICTCWNDDLLRPLVTRTIEHLKELGVAETRIHSTIIVPGYFLLI
jgi:6,7-dimethyl-8-ribityllumazine synthase